MKRSVEIIAQSVKDAVNAEKGGADRIELVSALSEGGLTPSLGMVEEVLKNVNIEVAVMVRPTSETFCYDEHYLNVIKRDIEIFAEVGVKRIVVGILDKNGNVDIEALNYVLSGADIEVTFHRAIDESKNILENIEKINSCKKVSHILTSGGKGKAFENLDKIRQIIEKSNKKIMLGSGLNDVLIDKITAELECCTKTYDMHFGTFAQDENREVSIEKVERVAKKIQKNKYE